MRNSFNILGFEGQTEVFSVRILLRASVSPAKRVVNLILRPEYPVNPVKNPRFLAPLPERKTGCNKAHPVLYF